MALTNDTTTPERSLLELAIEEAGGPDAFAAMLETLPLDEQLRLSYEWPYLARPSQLAPAGDWRTWLILAGRGFGKTRTGAEFIRAEVEAGRAGMIALVAPTAAAGRDIIVEGESGIIRTAPPWNRPEYEPSKRRVTWPSNGATATLFSADEPDRMRGHQADLAWFDELAAYFSPSDAWTQLQLGLRLGTNPRSIVTTTPRPIPLLRQLINDRSVVVTRGRTRDNQRNLAPGFVDTITATFGGTRIGRQELDGELLEDAPGALWRLADIDGGRVKMAPQLDRVVIGVDPAVSTKSTSNLTGIVAAGTGMCTCRGEPARHAFVLADYSGVFSPAEWAREVRDAYGRHRADRVVAEANQGGDLVAANLQANGSGLLPVKLVHATRGKAIRAEPVAALYEQGGKVHHVGTHVRLEDELCQWSPLESESPDRLDALVWTLTELMLEDAPVEYWRPSEPVMPTRAPRYTVHDRDRWRR